MSVGQLLEDPVYDQEAAIAGEVSLLGELLCPCFELTSGGGTVMVWFDLMLDSDETRPAVSVAGIANGDTVVVTGALRDPGIAQAEKLEFWATAIAAG
jgi:hypothetical protein